MYCDYCTKRQCDYAIVNKVKHHPTGASRANITSAITNT